MTVLVLVAFVTVVPLGVVVALNRSIERDLARLRWKHFLDDLSRALRRDFDQIVDVVRPVFEAIAVTFADVVRAIADLAPVFAQIGEALQEGPRKMIDQEDPLAHLYAETGTGGGADEILLSKPTSLEKLNAEDGSSDVEEISETDLDELALLVRSKLEGAGLPDAEAAELGLGELVDLGDGELELVLNGTGRAVFRRLIDSGYLGRFQNREVAP